MNDLDMFVRVQLCEDTPAAPSLENFSEVNGYCYDWKEGETPNHMKNGEDCTLQTCYFRANHRSWSIKENTLRKLSRRVS